MGADRDAGHRAREGWSAEVNTLRIQRWTVIGRELNELGRMARGETGYKRTVAPQEEREEQFIRFPSRRRVMVSWGGVPIVATAEFSLGTGRCIGHPDWVLVAEQLKPLRKLARVTFPREEKADDDERKAPEREEATPKEAPPAEAVGPVVVPEDSGAPPSEGGHAKGNRQRSLFE